MSSAVQPRIQLPQNPFIAYVQAIPNSDTLRINLAKTSSIGAETDVSWQEAIHLWQQNTDFRKITTAILAQAPYPAFFWETPPITIASLQQPWECVIVKAPSLANVTADPRPFSQYLEGDTSRVLTEGDPAQDVCIFPNLDGDALLIAPRPKGTASIYPHLATFVRNGPADQIEHLWQKVGDSIQETLPGRDDKPLWVSTSGLGVYWLHIRLDSFPKYYTYAPYRSV